MWRVGLGAGVRRARYGAAPMPRLPSSSTGARRAIPWAAILAAAQWTYEHLRELWEALEPREREEIRRLLERSKGRPDNLTREEQRRLRVLVMKAFRKRRRR